MDDASHTVRLAFPSAFELTDLVQVVSDHVTRLAGLDEDARHWVGVAVRESVINAIKHGNRSDENKTVFVEFILAPGPEPASLEILVRDEGEGFDPAALPDPLAPENLLKSSGRGIFFMRNFMDDVAIVPVPGGGMEVRMIKRLAKSA